MRTASASSLKLKIGATGPKISSRARRMAGVAPAITVGSKKVPPRAWRLPPQSHARAPGDGIGQQFLDLGQGGAVDQRPLRHALVQYRHRP
jgi:hypothetical protein